MPGNETFEQPVSPNIEFQDPELEALEQREGQSQPRTSEQFFSDEELQQVNQSDILNELLDAAQEMRDDPANYVKLCQSLYQKYFQEQKPEDVGEANRELETFQLAVNQLGIIREIVSKELFGETELTTGQKKLLIGFSLLIQGSLPPSDQGENDGGLLVNPEQVRDMVTSLNFRFVDRLPDDQFVSIDTSTGEKLVWADSPKMRGYDGLSVARQIVTAGEQEDLEGFGDGLEFGDKQTEVLEWFKERGIVSEDLHCFDYFKTQEAFVLARVRLENSRNPKLGQSTALEAEYLAMLKHKRSNPDNDYKISETIQKAYGKELSEFRAKWKIIKDSGIDTGNIQLTEDVYNYDSDGSDSISNSNLETQHGGSGSLEKNNAKQVDGGTRAGGLKIEGPKNVKEALFNMFAVAESEFGSQLNPVEAFIGKAA